ncbi:TPA: hypothetical protein JA361_08490 [Legionella pneumophila]|nr:hypothetical protein [Legionella pneumophila]HAT8182950.1 hypothetical protein [Legionella pneumophila]
MLQKKKEVVQETPICGKGSGRLRNPYKIDSNKLKEFIKEHADAFLNEIASHFGITAPAIHAAMKGKNITQKKTLLYRERCPTKRHQCIEVIEQLSPQRLVYVDKRAGERFARQSFVAGLMSKNIVAPFCYQGAMDNAAFHKSQNTLSIIGEAGCIGSKN